MNNAVAQPLTRQRHYGLDFLRIMAMLAIVTLHIVGRGGVMAVVARGSVSYYINRVIYLGSLYGVNCYALLSGYFGIGKRNRFASIAGLWLQVFVYSLGITLCFRLGFGKGGSLTEAALPVLFKQYWYFTAYFVLFLLSPVLNAALEKLSVSQLGGILLVAGVCFGLGSYFEDVFIFNHGYSAHWLIYLYLLGGMLRKTGTGNRRLRWLLLFVGTVLGNVLMQEIGRRCHWEDCGMLEHYTNPLMVLGCVSAFLFFANLKFKAGSQLAKIIGAISPLCFGVYLIHTHPIAFQLLRSFFSFLGEGSTAVMVLGIFGFAMGLFLLCSIIEALRQLIFRWLRIPKLLQKLGTKLDQIPQKLFKNP